MLVQNFATNGGRKSLAILFRSKRKQLSLLTRYLPDSSQNKIIYL